MGRFRVLHLILQKLNTLAKHLLNWIHKNNLSEKIELQHQKMITGNEKKKSSIFCKCQTRTNCVIKALLV